MRLLGGAKNTIRFHLFRFPRALGDQCTYDVFQVTETGGDAFYWRDFGGAEFYILFYDQPAGIAVLLQYTEEFLKVDGALSNDGESVELDSLLEIKFFPARLGP